MVPLTRMQDLEQGFLCVQYKPKPVATCLQKKQSQTPLQPATILTPRQDQKTASGCHLSPSLTPLPPIPSWKMTTISRWPWGGKTCPGLQSAPTTSNVISQAAGYLTLILTEASGLATDPKLCPLSNTSQTTSSLVQIT